MTVASKLHRGRLQWMPEELPLFWRTSSKADTLAWLGVLYQIHCHESIREISCIAGTLVHIRGGQPISKVMIVWYQIL